MNLPTTMNSLQSFLIGLMAGLLIAGAIISTWNIPKFIIQSQNQEVSEK